MYLHFWPFLPSPELCIYLPSLLHLKLNVAKIEWILPTFLQFSSFQAFPNFRKWHHSIAQAKNLGIILHTCFPVLPISSPPLSVFPMECIVNMTISFHFQATVISDWEITVSSSLAFCFYILKINYFIDVYHKCRNLPTLSMYYLMNESEPTL